MESSNNPPEFSDNGRDLISEMLENKKKDPGKKSKLKRTNKINYIITLAVLLVIFWELGIFTSIGVFFQGLSWGSSSISIPQDFKVIEPDYESSIDRSSGKAWIRLVNRGVDEAIITRLEVLNAKNGQACEIDEAFPKTVDSGDKLDVYISGCGISSMSYDQMLSLGIFIDLKTTFRNRMYVENPQSINGELPDIYALDTILDIKSSGIVLLR